jgi:hypothetical protein
MTMPGTVKSKQWPVRPKQGVCSRSALLRSVNVLFALVFGFLGAVIPAFGQDVVADDGKRVALVIGNSDYAHITRLTNPLNDANDVAEKLRGMGFEVTLGLNVDHRGFDEVLRDFVRSMEGASVSLLFYAGHGLQVSGVNYALPVDADIRTETDLEFSAVSMDRITSFMERNTDISLIFLDACRNNPLTQTLTGRGKTRSANVSRGLAPLDMSAGTYIAFATAPGNVAQDGEGRNSPFTRALLDNIDKPNTDVRMMMIDVREEVIKRTEGKQVPWETNSLLGRFYFVTDTSEADERARLKAEFDVQAAMFSAWSEVAMTSDIGVLEQFRAKWPKSAFDDVAAARIDALRGAAVEQAAGAIDRIEEAAWERALATGTLEAIETYKREFPDGQYASLADTYLETLRGSEEKARMAELSIKERSAFESAMNDGSRPALDAFKTAYPRSAYVKFADELIAKLQAEPKAVTRSLDINDPEELYWATIKTSVMVDDYLAYDRVFPAGRFRDLAQDRLKALQDAGELKEFFGADEKEVLTRARLRRAAMKDVDKIPIQFLQSGLDTLGFPVKKQNGILDSSTRKAIRSYQASIGTEQTGKLTPQEIVDLLFEAATAGDPVSQTGIGTMLAQGFGIAQDYAMAANWLTVASRNGNVYATANLGILFRDGLGVERDPEKARQLLQQAASEGLPMALDALKSL